MRVLLARHAPLHGIVSRHRASASGSCRHAICHSTCGPSSSNRTCCGFANRSSFTGCDTPSGGAASSSFTADTREPKGHETEPACATMAAEVVKVNANGSG